MSKVAASSYTAISFLLPPVFSSRLQTSPRSVPLWRQSAFRTRSYISEATAPTAADTISPLETAWQCKEAGVKHEETSKGHLGATPTSPLPCSKIFAASYGTEDENKKKLHQSWRFFLCPASKQGQVLLQKSNRASHHRAGARASPEISPTHFLARCHRLSEPPRTPPLQRITLCFNVLETTNVIQE